MAKQILFLCGHNAGRSQMAMAIFNKLNKNVDFIAISAGTHPGKEINPVCVEVLREIGIDVSDKKEYYPKLVNDEMLKSSFRIYTMGCNVKCDFPDGIEVDSDWDLDDPAGQDIVKVIEIRDKIVEKVNGIVDEIEKIN